MVQDENILGNYKWKLIEVTDSSVFETNAIGQQGKLRMVINDIINSQYSNGTLFINEENTE